MRNAIRDSMRDSVRTLQLRVLRKIEKFVVEAMPPEKEDPFGVFVAPNALAINRARQEHLASLGLDLSSKKVLEVGAGIGLHTPFFLNRGCDVLVTDGRRENIAEATRRLPSGVRARVFDLESDESLVPLGHFDIVYCYGLLYHLSNPENALARIAQVCDTLLLETAVSPGAHDELLLVRDPNSFNQAVSGIGCRPTRLWVLRQLKALFGHSYIARTQPDYVDFPNDWKQLPTQMLYRSIFVASRKPLDLATLTDAVPDFQATFRASAT